MPIVKDQAPSPGKRRAPGAGILGCKIRCHLRADVDEHIGWSPDVASRGVSGFGGHPRTLLTLGVVSSRTDRRKVYGG